MSGVSSSPAPNSGSSFGAVRGGARGRGWWRRLVRDRTNHAIEVQTRTGVVRRVVASRQVEIRQRPTRVCVPVQRKLGDRCRLDGQ
jgi:hypothetical protein